MSKFIIGGGITGLVWKYYHPEFQIISPEQPGGTYGKTYMVWMHDTFETRKLLMDLGMEVKKKKSKIGYYHNNWISDGLDSDMNLKMIQKKMTSWDQPLDTSFVPRTRDLSLSAGNVTNYMNTLDVDLPEVIRRLSVNANIENGFMVNVNDETITTKKDFSPGSTETVRKYDKLVSTMAAPLYWKAAGNPKDFKCLPITNVVTNKKPAVFDNRYEMIYYDDGQKFSRASFIDGMYALEFTGEISKEKFQELYPDLPIVDYFVVKQGRIFENDFNIPQNEKVMFSGRFAQWKYGIVTENVIAQAMDYKE